MSAQAPKPENLAKLVLLIRGERVLLDTALSERYGVEARALNQSVKRNLDRFPADLMFQLTPEEWAPMRSQTVTSSPPVAGVTSQIVMSHRRGGRRIPPYAFTEQGVAMLSTQYCTPHYGHQN